MLRPFQGFPPAVSEPPVDLRRRQVETGLGASLGGLDARRQVVAGDRHRHLPLVGLRRQPIAPLGLAFLEPQLGTAPDRRLQRRIERAAHGLLERRADRRLQALGRPAAVRLHQHLDRLGVHPRPQVAVRRLVVDPRPLIAAGRGVVPAVALVGRRRFRQVAVGLRQLAVEPPLAAVLGDGPGFRGLAAVDQEIDRRRVAAAAAVGSERRAVLAQHFVALAGAEVVALAPALADLPPQGFAPRLVCRFLAPPMARRAAGEQPPDRQQQQQAQARRRRGRAPAARGATRAAAGTTPRS